MNKIRSSRLSKFRKQHWNAIITTKLVSIWILFSFSLIYLTGNTSAYFNDHSVATGLFTAGFWEEVNEKWDKSSLKFIKPKDDINLTSCEPINISATLKNTGNDMQGTTEYYVYHIMKGNPKNGDVIHEGQVEPINKNQTLILDFKAQTKGTYKFKVLQRPGHGNKYETRHALWSETVEIKCKDSKAENEASEEVQDVEESGNQNESNQQENSSDTEEVNEQESNAEEVNEQESNTEEEVIELENNDSENTESNKESSESEENKNQKDQQDDVEADNDESIGEENTEYKNEKSNSDESN